MQLGATENGHVPFKSDSNRWENEVHKQLQQLNLDSDAGVLGNWMSKEEVNGGGGERGCGQCC